ncbi:MAG: WD40 repeat domain-containing protein [Oscillatoriaceae bacterium SKW80]|nr:WD40 repeat domain-containing protein [Oscillatoriaceae bacterium SKYG93]MCX8122264.1 WD40 repeat domain-containing protein [Oscillatoriaceae bacterium SKW80]MDW8454550.1 WD40 repeat domain-containing protein [Oscillatoriaceae cyanobacterium SKYGB_i_bin93]HIK29412.1 WD40 repeat domain-containing protein [Oscillatoriaceae cyanobacterium M7585_C2015_266]
MEYWFKLILEYGVPILNSLVNLKNGIPISGIHLQIDDNQQAQLMLEFLDSEKKNSNSQPCKEKLVKLGYEEAQDFIKSAVWAIQQNSLEFQRWRFAQEKALQQQLAIYNRETQLKLAHVQRETNLKLAEVGKILERWPLRLLPSQILASHADTVPEPLRIIIAPPDLKAMSASLAQQFNSVATAIPDIDSKLAQGLREFLYQNYPLHGSERPTEFLGGAWDSDRFYGEASIKAIFALLKSEPILILESEIDGEHLIFRMAYWGKNQNQYCYVTLFKLPYREIIRSAVKTRARQWKQNKEKLIALGKNIKEIEKLAGDSEINLKILEEEEELERVGIETSNLLFMYQLNSKDFEAFTQLLIRSHCIVAGWMADIHHLVYNNVTPRLPQLLPDLTETTADKQLLQAVMNAALGSYRQVLAAIAIQKLPETLIKLAQSLVHLNEKSWAIEQLNYSIKSWLQLHQLNPESGISGLEKMKSVVSRQDTEYLEALRDCWQELGNEQAVTIVKEMLSALAAQKNQSKLEVLETITLNGISGRTAAVAIGIHKTSTGEINQILAGTTEDNTIKLWQVPSKQKNTQELSLLRTLSGNAGQLLAIALSGDILASSERTGQRSHIYIWNIHTGELIRTLFGHKKCVYALALSPDAQFLASGSHKIKIWNLLSGEPMRTLFGHREWVYSLAISPDSKLIASGSEDKTIKIWQPHSETLLRTLSGHEGAVYSVAISPDGQFLVSGSADKTVKIWQLSTGKLLHTLVGHQDTVYTVAISPDGQIIISGSADKTIKIWNLHSGEECKTLTGHTGAVYSLALAPDGSTFASSSADKTIKLWLLQP